MNKNLFLSLCWSFVVYEKKDDIMQWERSVEKESSRAWNNKSQNGRLSFCVFNCECILNVYLNFAFVYLFFFFAVFLSSKLVRREREEGGKL